MPSTPDPLKGRLWEELVYGTPAYRFSTTPDGRIVTEQYRTRREGEQHHRELIGIQRDVIGALKDLHDGQSVVTREEYLRKEDETQGILRQAAGSLWTLHADQQALLDENRALGQITQRGFGELQEGVEGVRQSVEESTHTLHGPEYPAASIADVSRRQGNFVEALAAYKKGILSDGAKRDLERLINSRTALPQPRRQRVRQFLTTAIGDDEFVDAGGQYPLQTYVPMATSVIDNPAELIGPNAGEALGKLRVLALAERNHPDDELRGFIRDAFAIAGVAGRAKDMPLSEAFIADLTNSGLVTDGIQHEVKRFIRGARLGGTDVDRNYNLMELLEQGDYARAQRDAILHFAGAQVDLSSRQVALGEKAVGQGNVAIQQRDVANTELRKICEHGAEWIRQGRISHAYFGRIVDGILDTNTHLVNLEELGREFIAVTDRGFSNTIAVLDRGFLMEAERLVELTAELALTRAVIVGRLRKIEETVREVSFALQQEVAYGNRLLERLVGLTLHSLQNTARQRFQQGLAFLERATTADDFAEAHKIFVRGVMDDPTMMENQYGCAVTAEALHKKEEAKKRYRIVGIHTNKEQKELGAHALERLANIEEEEGDFPSAITYLKMAVEKNAKNIIIRWRLSRCLALTGLKEEAIIMAQSVIAEAPEYVFRLKADFAFTGLHLDKVYAFIWDKKLTRSSNILLFLFEEFLLIGDTVRALAIFQRYMEWSPETLLRSKILESSQIEKIRKKIDQALRKITENELLPYSAEGWYAVTFVMVRLNTAPQDVLVVLRRGLERDMVFHRKDRSGVLKNLEKVSSSDLAKLRASMRSIAPDLKWFL